MDHYNNTEGMQDQPLSSKPSIKQVSILYMITVVLFLFIGSRVQHREFYSGILITEFLLIMTPAVVMLLIYKYDVKRILRLNRVGILNLFLVLCIMLFTLPVVAVFNLVNLSLIKQIFGRVLVQQPPIAADSLGLFISVLVIGGSAGICEEVLFRGIIQRGFERIGIAKAILISSFLFGLMHMDFQKLLGTFLLGGLIGFIVYRTNSLYAGMFAHFFNNSLAVVVSYASGKLMDMVNSSGINTGKPYASDVDFSSLFEMPLTQLIAVIVVWGFIFLFCAAVLIGLLVALVKNTEHKVEKVTGGGERIKLEGMVWLLPPVVFIGFIYFAQGLGLLGIEVEAIHTVLRIIGVR